MRFWDSSALVGLFVQEVFSERVRSLARKNPLTIVWWGTRIECVSAIMRLERERRLDLPQVAEAMQRLEKAAGEWSEINPSDRLREYAVRLLRVHSLRAGDALQLAAALIASEHHPPSLEFVCLDARLSIAAMKEGFQVVDGSNKLPLKGR